MAQSAIHLAAAQANRRPAGGAYKLYGQTSAAISSLEIEVCNTNPVGGATCNVSIALIEPGYAYADGDVPSEYQFLCKGAPIEPASLPVAFPVKLLPSGWKVVVSTDVVGANFNVTGLTES